MVSACSVRVCFVVAGVCPARAVRWVYKTGKGTCLVGSFPRFSCVERMTGLEPAAFTLGG